MPQFLEPHFQPNTMNEPPPVQWQIAMAQNPEVVLTKDSSGSVYEITAVWMLSKHVWSSIRLVQSRVENRLEGTSGS